jgi:hypothetical protein
MAGQVDGEQRGNTLARACVLVAAVAALAAIPACSSTTAPTAGSTPAASGSSTSTSLSTSVPSPTFQQGSAAEVDDCEADAKVLEVALEAYMAEHGSFPTPPAPWAATTYVGNFAPLTSAAAGGPLMHSPPSTDHYVVEYDSAGRIWVAPPGAYGAAFNPAQDFDTNPDSCLAAVR